MGGPQMIVDLARAGDLEELKAALAGGCSPNEKCARNASTPLIAAAGKGHLSIVKHVLGVGAELDHENDEGASAADAALAMGHQDVVKTLAKHELIGSTRLRFAVEQDDHEGLPQLLGRAQRSTRRDDLLECALGEACWLGRPSCVARILEAGASACGLLKSWDASPLDVAWASWANGARVVPDHERREVMRLLTKAGGAHAELVGLLGRLLWRKWRSPHSYARWAVLAAMRACHLRAKPWPQAPPPRPNKLLVVLRGEAFRTGGWLSRDTGGALADQQAVYDSLARFALLPLTAAGWEVTLVVDASFGVDKDAVRTRSREGAVRASCAALGARHVRLNAPMCETQRQGWLATVEWATELEPDNAALLVLRNDMLLKTELKLPSAEVVAADPAVYVPWFHKSNYNTTGGADRSSNGGRRVADTLMLVPATRMRAFAHFLSAVPYAPTWTQFSLHELADPIDGIDGGNVRALDATCRESDSAKGWNPLYSLAGRHVSQYGR